MKQTYALLAIAVAFVAVFSAAAVSGSDGQAVAADVSADDMNIDFQVSAYLDPKTDTEVLTIVMLETGKWDFTLRVYDSGAEYYNAECTIDCNKVFQEFVITGVPALDDEHVYTVSLEERTDDPSSQHKGTASLDPYHLQTDFWFDRLRNDFEVNGNDVFTKGTDDEDGYMYTYNYEVRHFNSDNVYTGDYEVLQSGEAPFFNLQQVTYLSLPYENTKEILPNGYYRIIMTDGDDLVTYSEPMYIYNGAPLVTVTVHFNGDISQTNVSSYTDPYTGVIESNTSRDTIVLEIPQYSFFEFDGNVLDVTSRDVMAHPDVPLHLAKVQVYPDTGYDFDHWSLSEVRYDIHNDILGTVGMPDDERTAVFHDLDFYAHFDYHIFNITYKESTYIADEYNPTTYCMLDEIHLDDDYREGYDFLGWTGPGLPEPTRKAVIPKGTTGDLTFTANWAVADYKLTYTNLMVAEDPGNPTSVRSGVDCFYLKNPKLEGKCFTGWTWEGHQLIPRIDTLVEDVYEDRTYEAHWTDAVYHNITYTNLEGSDYPDNPTKAKYDDEFVLINPIMAGYIFSGWVNENVPEDFQHIRLVMKVSKVDEDRTYRAEWFKIPEYWGTQDMDFQGGNGDVTDTLKVPVVSEPGPQERTGDTAVYAVTGAAALAGILGLLVFLRRRT